MITTLCPWGDSSYFFFSENVPRLIHYSHTVAIISALLVGVAIFVNNPRDTVARLLLLITVTFSIWAGLDVILWATNNPNIVMFSWATQVLIEPLMYSFTSYLVYFYFFKKWPPFWTTLLVFLLLVPLIVLLPTAYNIQSLTLSTCEVVEGPLAKYYSYFLEGLSTLTIIAIILVKVPKLYVRRERIAALCFSGGLVIFLLSFTSGNILSSFTDDWRISQYGLFGMPIFTALIAYSIVKFRAFNIKVIATQMLVIVLALAVLSLVSIQQIQTVRIISLLTFVLVCVLGFSLIRAVKKEIRLRERIELLAKDLELANDQQVVLIHFITHQIKGFIAKSRNIFSMALEGDFGPVSPELKPMLQAGYESDTKGANTISEILNAANIKSGKVTYAMAPFDLGQLIEEVAKELEAGAINKGLSLTRELGSEPLMVTGDRAQLINVFKNLIDNAIKYTPAGDIHISLTKKDGKVQFEINDNGVGITPEDMKNLFTEGGHGKESSKVNVESTGFGLYIVKNIVDAHKGRVWATSEGAGKGSHFFVELPV